MAVHLKGTFNCVCRVDPLREHRGSGRHHQHVVGLGVRGAGPAELRRRQGRHHGPDLVHCERARALRRHRQRDHAERRDPHDRLDAARQGASRTRQVAERDGRRAPSATRTTSRRWWSTSPATPRRTSTARSSTSYGYGYTLLEQPQGRQALARTPLVGRGAGRALPRRLRARPATPLGDHGFDRNLAARPPTARSGRAGVGLKFWSALEPSASLLEVA